MTSSFCFSGRYVAENVGSAAEPEREEGAAAETTSPSSEDQAEDEDKPPHDNYVNFDIAQTVLEANARKEAQARGEATTKCTTKDWCYSLALSFLFFQLIVFLPCQ